MLNKKAQTILVIFIFAVILAIAGALYYSDYKSKENTKNIIDKVNENNNNLQNATRDAINTPIPIVNNTLDYQSAYWTQKAKLLGINQILHNESDFWDAYWDKYGYGSGGGSSGGIAGY